MSRVPLLSTLSALLLGGCVTTASTPQINVPPAASGGFVETRNNAVTPAPTQAIWWRLFDDPVLDRHVERALAANASVRVAVANLQTSRAAARQARAAFYPRAGAESGVGPIKAVDQPSTTMIPTTDYDIGGTVAYELDLFGRVQSASSATRADAQASAAALDAARVTVAADTVLAYVDLCGAIANERIAHETVQAQRRSVELVNKQLEEGDVSPLELAQARALLHRAEAALPPFSADRRRALFQLATLQGKAPAEADGLEVGCTTPPKLATEIPVGDGAALIARRPDIREAERHLAAATARIGVATADLYPRISLGGSAGLLSGGFDTFFTPLISWAFLDWSAVRGRIEAAKGTEAAALANWDAVMLRALREVESALADYRAESIRGRALAGALAESEKAAARARTRYRLGAESFLLVLDAERSRNDAASQMAASDIRKAQIQVTLFRALGGGWETSSAP